VLSKFSRGNLSKKITGGSSSSARTLTGTDLGGNQLAEAWGDLTFGWDRDGRAKRFAIAITDRSA